MFSQKGFESSRWVGGLVNFAGQVAKSQPDPREYLLITKNTVQQFSPVWDSPMFEHEFEGDVFEEQILGSAKDCG
jgi:hypothetical protein